MLKHLISLVFLLVALYCVPVFSDTTSVILPKIKPKNLTTLVKKKEPDLLPLKKPALKEKRAVFKKAILPKSKPLNKLKNNNITQNKIKNEIKINNPEPLFPRFEL